MLIRKSLAQIFALLFLAAVTWQLTRRLHQSDLHLYYCTAERIFLGQIPCIDFPFEYPPLAALIFCGPRLFTFFHHSSETLYRCAFAIQNALLTALAIPPLLRLARHAAVPQKVAVLRYTALLCVLFPVVIWRFDIAPSLATVLAIVYLVDERPIRSGVWLGLGIAAKLYPVVLLPILMGYELSRRRPRAAARILLVALIVTALPLIPYLMRHSTAFVSFLRYHERRGLQIESFPAGVIELAAQFKWTTISTAVEYGALHIHSPWEHAALRSQPIVMATALIGFILLSYRRMRREFLLTGSLDVQTLLESALAMLLIFMAANKVFSPQYLVWAVPFVPLLRPMLWRTILVAAFATTFLFLVVYHRLKNLEIDAVLLLNLRNALIIAVIVMIAARLLNKPNPPQGVDA